MVLTAWDNALTSHPSFTGFPSVLVDRQTIMDPSDLEGPTMQTAMEQPVALLSVFATYDESTREYVVEASAQMNETIDQAGYRLNVVLTENGVTGTSNGYAQVNAYSGGGNGPMGGYENLPSPVPADLMVYDHVGRALLGTYDGVAGSLPDMMEQGQIYSHTFDAYTIPAGYNTDNIEVIVMLLDQNGNVVNAGITSLAESLVVFYSSNG